MKGWEKEVHFRARQMGLLGDEVKELKGDLLEENEKNKLLESEFIDSDVFDDLYARCFPEDSI